MNAETPVTSAPPWIRGRISGWVFATDHKRVGALWLAVGGLGLLVGGLLALLTALQTARADGGLLGEGTYASVATMQGTLLTYGGLLPLALGLVVIVVPLQLGARGLALSGLATAGLWLGISGLVAITLSAFAPGDAPRSWWTTYPPLALDQVRPGETVRLMGFVLVALATFLTAIAVVATLRGARAPGLTDARLPLFTRAAGAFAAAQLLVAPLALIACLLLLLAREQPGSFAWYVTDEGELLQGYGWVFDQTLVTLSLVVALGVAAEIVATFARAPLRSRRVVSAGIVATTVALVVVPSADVVDDRAWAAALALFAVVPVALVAAVLLPVGLGALRREGRTTPLAFAVLALALTLLGALAALLFLVRHDDLGGTAFGTARLGALYVATLAALLGGVVYWWPKLSGRTLDARLTNLSAVVLAGAAVVAVVGFAIAGWNDQLARTGTTTDDAAGGALLASLGVLGVLAGVALFGLAGLRARTGRRVGHDPWRGDTLEWYTTSPPPPGNFTSLPPVESERPLADLRSSLEEQGAL